MLLIALIFFVILSLAAATAMRASLIEMLMSSNEVARFTALELSQSIAEQVAADPENFPVADGEGTRYCSAGVDDCDRNSIIIEQDLLNSGRTDRFSVIVERLAPALSSLPRAINTSADAFAAARFEVDVDSAGRDGDHRSAGIAQGVLLLVPRRVQIN